MTATFAPPAPTLPRSEPVEAAPAPVRPRWELPALGGLLGITAILYLWGLGSSGWANSYYSMAVQAGTKSWKAFFFGSLDAGNSITVDKTPASLWPMEISARIFGVNSWSILVPQALEGVATVGLLYAAVKRWFGSAAGLLAGAVMACTPVAALMFRFNNPDAFLVLLLVGGAYALTRALERGQTWWLVLAFSCVGFGFLTKELQALLVIPPFALTYLVAGPPTSPPACGSGLRPRRLSASPSQLGRRVAQLAIAVGGFVVSCGWWIAAVQLTPASSRPYIGGSQNNSLWNVIFGYNGFGRLTGNETGSVGGGPAGRAGRWGPTGVFRMFNAQFGAQASWLIPAACVLLVAGLIFTARMPRTDRTRAALLLWGGWLVVTAGAFSLGQGIIHPYYTVALAPAIGALVGIGATRCWNGRRNRYALGALVAAFAATVVWSYVLLGRVPSWHPELRTLVLFGGIAVALALAFVPWRTMSKGGAFVATAALVVALAGPAAYTLSTVAAPHTGAIPSAGPASAATAGFPGGPGGGPGGANGGGPQFGRRNGTGFGNGAGAFGPPPGAFGGGTSRRGGGLLDAPTVSAEVKALLQEDASSYTWVAATNGANNAAGYQLATGDAVMALGGFNGTDPSPTLAQFQSYVAQHEIHYFIGGGGGFGGRGFGGFGGGFAGGFGGGPGGGSSTTSQIAQWVQQNFTSQTVGGVTVYDLTE